MFAVVLCVLMSAAFVSCSDDDPNGLEGEWISDDGDIYYQFLSNGTGRYICLADEPGYNVSNPGLVIDNPEDPYYFDYTIDGNILTMKEYAEVGNQNDFTIYVCEIRLDGNTLQIKDIRWSDNGVDWNEDHNPQWDTYIRR